MGPQLLHYRAWQGHFRSPLRSALPIARVALGMLLRRKMFWIVYAAGLFIFLMFFFGSYLLDWATTQLQGTRIQVGNFQADTERMVQMLREGLRVLNGSQDTFGYFFVYQGAMVMVVLALAGSVLVGNDFTFGSLPFYLAKPISRWHYIVGKCLAVGVIVNLMTTLPALLLFAQHGLDDWSYLTDPAYFYGRGMAAGPAGLPLLAGILGYGLVLTVCLSIMLVAAATWMRRTMPLVLCWTSLFLFCRLLAGIIVDGLHYDARWRLLDLWNNLRLLGSVCLAIDHERIWPQPQPEFWEAAVVLGVVCLLCLSYLNRRTRAVEIVT
jgi:ABC-type transport system involved in multi-copper enzyme maturation permease subunit